MRSHKMGSRKVVIMACGVGTASASLKSLRARGTSRISRRQVGHPETSLLPELKLGLRQSVGSRTPTSADRVQFGCAIFYAEEGQEKVTIDIMRLGSLEGTCYVRYQTIPGTAKPGDKYVHQEGHVTFDNLVSCQQVSIPIIPDPLWNQVLEFRVALSLESNSNCELSQEMSGCRVKIIDNDIFPSDKFSKQIAEGTVRDIPGVDLFMEYFKFNLQLPDMWWKSVYVLLIDQLPNLYFLLTTYLVKYVADNIVGNNQSNTNLISDIAEGSLLAVAALYVLPYAILQLLAYTKVDTGLEQTARTYLQASAFARFMNLSDEERGKVNVTDVKLTIAKDVDDLVTLGFMKVYEVAASAGSLACICYFLLSENPTSILPIAVYALFVPWAFAFNYKKNVELSDQTSVKQADIVDAVKESHEQYRLIADYRMRPLIEVQFEERLVALNSVMQPREKHDIDQSFLSGWVGTLLIGIYLFFGANQVIGGDLQLGTFLATVNVFKEVADNFKETYSAVLEISRSISPLQKLTQLMNSDTELSFMSSVMHRRQHITRALRSDTVRLTNQRTDTLCCGTDAIPIQVLDLSFTHPNGKEIMKRVNLIVKQGTMVAVIGLPGGGKSTFMQLLGYIKQPSHGLVYMPSHLRVLHVPAEPTLLGGSLWKNIALDKQPGCSSFDERVIRICLRVGISKELVAQLKAEIKHAIHTKELAKEDGGTLEIDLCASVRPSWQQEICGTDVALINIARAFIFNAEVLVLHKPTALLCEGLAKRIFECLKEHQLNRGLELPPETRFTRRPRTLFISTVRMLGIDAVDTVWVVGGGTVQEIPKLHVTKELLT